MSTITERFFELHPKSAALADRGRRLFPDGVTHDIRRFDPFTMYMDHGAGRASGTSTAMSTSTIGRATGP